MRTAQSDAALAHLREVEPRFRPYIDAHGAPPWKRTRNPFHALSRAIVFQQLSGKAATTIFTRFEALFPGQSFPTPEDVLKKPLPRLKSAGLSKQKASYLKDLARCFRDEVITPKRFGRMSDEAISIELLQVKGIGQWSADMFLMFALNRPDVLPVGDLGVKKGLQVLLELQALPTALEMQRLAEPWRSYRSYASWYLWRAAESP